MSSWPQPLQPVRGPLPLDRLQGAADGMGPHGPVTRSLHADGLVAPDLICGQTLHLLANQPRPPRDESAKPSPDRPEKASPIAGGVWVREQFTIHRPLPLDDPFTITGESTGRFVRKGRRYGITCSQTHDQAGRLVATNVTNGLLAYRVEEGLADQVEGRGLDEIDSPRPDAGSATANPHAATIAAATPGQRFGGQEVVVSLAMMAARDTTNPTNPIHSDPEAARQAGLARPIAGGSHVLSFALEPILAAWGPGALSHGARFDVRWKAPTEADVAIIPSATVSEVRPDGVDLDLEVVLADGNITALTGTVTVPLPHPDPDPDPDPMPR